MSEHEHDWKTARGGVRHSCATCGIDAVDVIATLTQRLAAAETAIQALEIDNDALEEERNGFKYTLDLWNAECGGLSPRAFAAAQRAEENRACEQIVNEQYSPGPDWECHAARRIRARREGPG